LNRDAMSDRRTKARQRLLDSAMVLLAQNPGASYIEIAKAAGVGRATLHRHFPSREDLLKTLTLDAIEATDAASARIEAEAQNSLHTLRLTFEAMIELGDRYYFLTRLPEPEDQTVRAHIERQNKELQRLILWAQQDGVIDPDVPFLWAATVVNYLIYAAWEMRSGSTEITKDQLVDLSMRTLGQGLGKRQSGPAAQ